MPGKMPMSVGTSASDTLFMRDLEPCWAATLGFNVVPPMPMFARRPEVCEKGLRCWHCEVVEVVVEGRRRCWRDGEEGEALERRRELEDIRKEGCIAAIVSCVRLHWLMSIAREGCVGAVRS